MKTNSLTITIDNYDNAAMADDPSGETVRILKGIIAGIENYGVPNADGKRLKDTNGNTVGSVSVDFSEDDEDSDDDDTTVYDGTPVSPDHEFEDDCERI